MLEGDGVTTPYRLYGALGAILALALLIAWGRHGYALADQWRTRAGVEASNHRQTKVNYKAAQILAYYRARAAREATEKRSRDIAKEIDHANEQAALWRAAAARFANGGGMRSQARTDSSGAPGRSGAVGETDVAARGDGSGPTAVVLSRADFDALTANTERLLRVHDWGERLIDEGLALKAGE